MTDTQLLVECKRGLDIQELTTEFDDVILQKIRAVKSFMTGAGVNDFSSDLAVGAIVMGVTDLWNTEGGGVKFSPALSTLITQLAVGGNYFSAIFSPVADSVGVSTLVAPVITFNKRVRSYSVRLAEYLANKDVLFSASLDITEKVLTLTPNSALESAKKYAVVAEAISREGDSLSQVVIAFTTA